MLMNQSLKPTQNPFSTTKDFFIATKDRDTKIFKLL
jgi:hypothetical protein